ncbi:MAG: decarboxylase [Patescibacteria group bacterium]
MKKTVKPKASSALTDILNKKTCKSIRWCTPSIDIDMEKVIRPYKSDMSVSYTSLGMPSVPSGIFKTMYKKAAKAYGSDNTLFSVNGSTGSNFIVLRALSKQIPYLKVLAMRNIHKSVLHACEDYGINLMLLPPTIDDKLQIFLPNTIDEIVGDLEKVMPDVLLVTNPTYEGVTLDLKTLVKRVRKKFPNIIIFVEEAWGSHLFFSKKLPLSAMEAGADICIQSTHKQGGALQQGGMIHWTKERVNSETLLDSYESLTTSSPSYILLASLDAARVMMERDGKKKIDTLIAKAAKFSEGIKNIHGLEIVTKTELLARNPSVYDRDITKVMVDVSQTGLTGFKIAKVLEETYKIIVEKYDAKMLLFLTTFQVTDEEIAKTVKALGAIVASYKGAVRIKKNISINIPKTIIKRREISDIAKLRLDQVEKIPLEDAAGRIAAEDITIYPPGIPITIKGEQFTNEMIEYYLKCREYSNCKILSQDNSFKTVIVVK